MLNYTAVPFGNAFFATEKCPASEYSHTGIHCWLDECSVENPPSDCFTGNVYCQHGEEECNLNLHEACAVYLYPSQVLTVAEYSNCIEGDGDADSCAAQVGLDQIKIAQCVAGKDGQSANTMAGMQTASLNPQHTGTPWVVVNGKHLDNQSELLYEVCALLDRPKPAGCKGLETRPRASIKATCKV